MLREHSTTFRRLMIFSDIGIIVGAFFIGYFLRNFLPGEIDLNFYLGLLPIMLAIWGCLLHSLGLYQSFRTKTIPEVIFIIFKSCLLGIFVFTSIIYLCKIPNISRLFIVLNFVVVGVCLGVEKVLVISLFRYLRDKGYNFRNVLVVGTGRRAQHLISMIDHHRGWGLKIIGLIDDESDKIGQEIKGYKVLGTLKDLIKIIHTTVVDEVIFVIPWSWLKKIEETILACEIEGVKVHLAVDLYEPLFSRLKVDNLYTVPLLTIGSMTDKLGSLLFKRLFDVVSSALGLVFLAPLLLAVALVIKLTSKGPVLFRQERFGLNGRKFMLYKFRTMGVDAHERLKEFLDKNEMKGPAFKLANDPRVTPVGKFLRKSSLDELPQLWNILKGDMSLIGPRPPIPAEVEQYDAWQRRRLRMRPGLTCLWQVQGRNKITDFNEWAQLDLEYIDNWSLWLDIKILFKTVPVVLFGIGAK